MFDPTHRMPPPRMALVRIALLAPVIAALAACGGMSGKYEAADGGGDSIEFQGDRVYVTITPAPTIPGEYEIEGDKVIITVGGQSMALSRRGDTLEGGPFGMTFVKAVTSD
jgi:hypothetical protein